MLAEGTHYREILKNELSARMRTNTQYSLRAFARDLGLAPSRLSEIFNGKQGLSRKAALKIAKCLGYNFNETEYFCDLVESVHSRSRVSRRVAQVRVQERLEDGLTKTLRLDAFKAISEWYHFAILCLIELDGFSPSPDWLATRLKLNRLQVQQALRRLERLKLIERKGRTYRVLQDYVSSPNDIPSDAIKQFHKAVLEKAAEALYSQPLGEREFSSVMMSLDTSRLEEAKDRIRKFGVKLVKSMDSSPKKNRVYCLSIQFFRLA